jgi:hypothetical protein
MMRQFATTSAIAVVAALPISCSAALSGSPPTVPEKLRAPAGQVLALEVQAAGVQIYECNSNKADITRLEWIFKAPEAILFDSAGRKIGKHYGGPTWESNDGSKVLGEMTARDDGPDADAIPWLLLKATSTTGTGVFGQTQSIQRVRTVGGKAPAQSCALEQVGREARMPYKATYYFYTPRP